MVGALDGVKILDVTQLIGAAHGTSVLAELGADVVKVEPIDGEPWRNYKSVVPRESRVYQYRNRGKRGVALDLASEHADHVRTALLRWADVLVTNLPSAEVERLHLGEAAARTANANLIYCDVTRLGKFGPSADVAVDEMTVQALSGMQTSNQAVRAGLPQMVAFTPAELVAGLAMALGVVAAVLHRDRTGEPQAVTTSTLHAALFLQSPSLTEIVEMDAVPRERRLAVLADARARGADLEEMYAAIDAASYEQATQDGDKTRGPLRTDLRPGSTYTRTYRTRDGYVAVSGAAKRSQFCAALCVDDPSLEPAFDDSNALAAALELQAVCEAIFASGTVAEMIERLGAHDVACTPVKFADEMWDDEQVLANGYIVEYEHPRLGAMRGLAPIVQMSATPPVARPAPALGEHNDDVLRTIGFDENAIAGLRVQGVVR